MDLSWIINHDSWVHLDKDNYFAHYVTLLYILAVNEKLKPLVEIGVEVGYSTKHLLLAAKALDSKLYSVDILDRSSIANKLPRELKDRWIFINSDSVKAGENWKGEKIGLLFVDGNHDYKGVLADLKAWYPHVKANGIIAMHDCHYDSDVMKAVTDFFKGRNVEIFVIGGVLGMAIVRKLET